MSGEVKTHSQGEVDLLIAVAEVRTLQKMALESFNDHVRDDDKHFQRLYDNDEKIIEDIAKIPNSMVTCSEKIKTDILSIARHEFTSITAFKVFRTQIIYGMLGASAAGSLLSVVLNILVNSSKLTGIAP